MLRFFLPALLAACLRSPESHAQAVIADFGAFTFTPDYILPRTGVARQLYGVAYSLVLTKDSLMVDLPYEGRAWSVVSPDPRYQGIRFTALKFTTRSNKLKNGTRQLTISPEDGRDVYRLSVTISPKGDASVQVYSDRRDMVGFSGKLEQRP